MNFEPDQNSSLELDLFTEMRPKRRMRVRHSYPQALTDLVKLLLFYLKGRDISQAIDIPLSSIYRWRGKNPAGTRAPKNVDTALITDLIADCERDGFRISPTIIALLTRRPDIGSSSPNPTQHALSVDQCAPHNSEVKSHIQTTDINLRKRLEPALHAIRNEYFRDLDSQELARLANMSRHHFIRAFSATYGISPHQYLIKVRIEVAKKILLHSTETIDVVAAATGFRSGACLNRTFTRMEGHCISRFCRIVKNRKHDQQ